MHELKKISFHRKTSWIPGPAPLIRIPTNLELISKAAKQNIVSFTFNVTGNALKNLYSSDINATYFYSFDF